MNKQQEVEEDASDSSDETGADTEAEIRPAKKAAAKKAAAKRGSTAQGTGRAKRVAK